ncbi:MAG TPA: DsbA family oxidoreductase [Longimicrobiales bacterium]|nr:DsbA family oxidoreductase [Longimicrobiales bacterium]
MKVDIYSDIVCPWCYIGSRRFRRALAQHARAPEVEVVYRPFQLHPDAPARPMPLKTYLQGQFGAAAGPMMARVGEVAKEEGIEIDWSRAVAVNTLEAHRLLRLALTEYGPAAQAALVEALFAAHFCHGGDVSNHHLLTELAVASGLDRSRVTSYLTSGEGLDDTRFDIDRARRLRIQAVPTYIFEGRWKVQGAQRVETFVQVLQSIAAELDARAREDEPESGQSRPGAQ